MGDFICGLALTDLLARGPICRQCIDRIRCAKRYVKKQKKSDECQCCGRKFAKGSRGGWANLKSHERVCNA